MLITGAGGQLGSELRHLSEQDDRFRFIFTSHEELDIVDTPAVHEFFKRNQPQYCINCAAYTAVDKAETDRDAALLINAVGPMALASECNAHNSRLIHISTDYVFDGESWKPYTEDDDINPQTVYGSTKAEGERKVQEMSSKAMIIRTSWLYSVYGKNFVKTMLRLMKEKEEIGVVDDQLGTPTNARDLARAILHIIQNCDSGKSEWAPGMFHYSNDGITSWYGFAKAIKERANLPCSVKPITTAEYPTAAKRPAFSALNCEKIVKTYGVELRNWEESLAECVAELIR